LERGEGVGDFYFNHEDAKKKGRRIFQRKERTESMPQRKLGSALHEGQIVALPPSHVLTFSLSHSFLAKPSPSP
jgi:hypothetical protein